MKRSRLIPPTPRVIIVPCAVDPTRELEAFTWLLAKARAWDAERKKAAQEEAA